MPDLNSRARRDAPRGAFHAAAQADRRPTGRRWPVALCAASLLLAGSGAAAAANATNATTPAPFPDDPVRVAVEQFLEREATGLPGKAKILVMPPSGGRARDCVSPEPFLPSGTLAWGRVSVGVRCGGDRPWTRYMQARVTVVADYYVAARTLAPGEPLDPSDVEVRQGDLAALPRAVVTDPGQLAGAVTVNRIAAGSPLRMDLLRKAIAVRQGQNVTVAIEGDAFQIRSEGKIMTDASPGNSVQVRLKNGQVVNGVVKDADTVVLQQ